MSVLLIEDDLKTAGFLTRGLHESGFQVDVAHYGTEGLKLAQTNDYNIIILDVMIPGIDGWEVLGRLRERKKMTPVIYLTALDSIDDRLRGLDLGADDYIVKPFAFSELLERIYAILRRSETDSLPDRFKVADLELDLAAHKVVRNGKRIDLTHKEFLLLAILMRYKGEVLTRTRIAESICTLGNVPDTNVVDVNIRRLRSKVDEPFDNKLIHSVHGIGYILDERY